MSNAAVQATISLAPLVVALMVVTACAPARPSPPPTALRDDTLPVVFNGAKYAGPEAALAARRSGAELALAALPVEPDPVLGKLRIVIPDEDRLRPHAIAVAAGQGSRSLAAIAYYTDVEAQTMQIDAAALTRTHAFHRSEVIQQNDTLNPDQGDADFMLWYQVTAQSGPTGEVWDGRWLVRRAGSRATQTASFDAGTRPLSTAAYASLLKSVRLAALRLGGKTAAGAQPSTNPMAAEGLAGSGVIVDATGHVLTNNHVVPSCQSVRVFDGERDRDAMIVARDATNDLALLKLEVATPHAMAFRDGSALRAGESVVATGYPLAGLLGSDMSITAGLVTSLKGLHDDIHMMQVSAQIQPGNSGGPLLDEFGNVVGIMSRTLNAQAVAATQGGALPQNVNFAIKGDVVEEFLAANHVDYRKSKATHALSTPDIGDQARKFTVRVDCR